MYRLFIFWRLCVARLQPSSIFLCPITINGSVSVVQCLIDCVINYFIWLSHAHSVVTITVVRKGIKGNTLDPHYKEINREQESLWYQNLQQQGDTCKKYIIQWCRYTHASTLFSSGLLTAKHCITGNYVIWKSDIWTISLSK